jgi:chemotaxis protein MotB
MKNVVRVVGVTLFAVAMVGCVSTSKYKKLEVVTADLKTEQQKLQASANQLTQDNAQLKSDVDRVKSENAALAAEREALQKQHAESVSKYDDVVSKLSAEASAGQLQIKQFKNMVAVDIGEKVFFTSGSAAIKDSGKVVLKKVGDALAGYPEKYIRVVGHTDSVALGKSAQAKYSSNWELSVARATNVVRFLQDKCAIQPDRLIAAGRGPFNPVAPNATPEGRAKNRRIEIWLLDKSMVETETPSQ